ncbi:MAG: class I SAM-dependent methyltransferase, partial [Acidobacteriota bacterium]|nr:class I SAM-dependent methyltransferase [Acidobacteriota bacterium]
ISRATNPECEHVKGDMRSLRLGRTFDAVFVHDAVMYITTEEELHAVAETAFVHTRPGGAALFAPDYVKETFRERTDLITGERDGRALRCIEWSWDPNPDDTTFITDFAFALREEGTTTVLHDQHVEGLFARDTWLRVLESVGFRPEIVECVLDGIVCETFLCRRS